MRDLEKDASDIDTFTHLKHVLRQIEFEKKLNENVLLEVYMIYLNLLSFFSPQCKKRLNIQASAITYSAEALNL